MTLLLVALAGGCGAAARFLVDSAVTRRSRCSMPVGTIVVNVTACLLLGVLTGWGLQHSSVEALHVLTLGALGGYSTFSTASVEAARLLLNGQRLAALGHAMAMLLVSLLAAVLGVALGSW